MNLKVSLQSRLDRMSEFLERVEEQVQQQLIEAIYSEIPIAKLIQLYTTMSDAHTRAIKVLIDIKKFELDQKLLEQTKDQIEQNTLFKQEINPDVARLAESMLLNLVNASRQPN